MSIRKVLKELIEFKFDEDNKGASHLKLAILKGKAEKELHKYEEKLHWMDSASTDEDDRNWAQGELNDE